MNLRNNERKIEALRSMARLGTRNEREIAKSILDRMNIEEEEPPEFHAFKYSSSSEEKLLGQTCAMVFNTGRPPTYHKKGLRKTILVKCTKLEALELALFYESYSRALKEELEITTVAFIQKNKIFPSESIENPVKVPNAIKILERAASIDKVHVRKRLAYEAPA